jgi:hypothetical protein
MLDVDFIEWRFINGNLVPVGVMEATRVDLGRQVNDGYLNAITQRYLERDMQARATKFVAAKLDTKAYIILFRADCSEFWVFNLSDGGAWQYFDPKQMETFLKNLA